MTALEILQTKAVSFQIPLVEQQAAIDEVEQAIKNYCNIDVVPYELNYTWANMAVDLALYQNETNKPTQGASQEVIEGSDVSAIRVGDTSVEVKGGGAGNVRAKALKSHRPNLDSIVLNYSSQLNRFRRMVW